MCIRDRISLGGTIPLPFLITASPLLFAQSGNPYNITTGTPDPTTELTTDRPAFASGVTAANVNCRSEASFSNTQ